MKKIISLTLLGILMGSVFVMNASSDTFRLRSKTIQEGKAISANQYWNQFGCSGANDRPDLSWSGAPKNTQSFALTVYDKDAPTGSGFWHWVVYDIPAVTTKINPKTLPKGAVEGNTDLGKPGFFGPCPPVGRTHNYVYTLRALDTDKLGSPKGATAALTGFFINQHTIAKTTLTVVAGPRKK